MIVQQVAKSHNDEYYTPDYAIEPLLKYLKPSSKVWCPFDTSQSGYFRLLKDIGHSVVCTHLDDGYDFFRLVEDGRVKGNPIQEFDYIISNPPYTKKTEVLEALFGLKIPFAMLIGVVGLFESQRRYMMFKKHNFEIMYFNKRVSFYQDYVDKKAKFNPPFSSVYVCSGILPKQIVFEEIDKKVEK